MEKRKRHVLDWKIMEKKTFETLDIATADMAFAAYGKTLGEMFENAGRALFSIMFEPSKVLPKVSKKIKLERNDEVVLLHDFLAELLYIFDTEKIVFSEFSVRTDGKKLTAECAGEKLDPAQHKFITDVKAITYHKLEITRAKEGFKCVVVVDT